MPTPEREKLIQSVWENVGSLTMERWGSREGSISIRADLREHAGAAPGASVHSAGAARVSPSLSLDELRL
jgi:hypothetical protein